MTVHCPYCGALTTRRDVSFVYGGSWQGRQFLVCTQFPACDSYVGCHGDGNPLGTLANAELRRARMTARAVFDPLWRSGRMTRSAAYAWLSRALNLPPDQTHVGMFTKEQCEAVAQACAALEFA